MNSAALEVCVAQSAQRLGLAPSYTWSLLGGGRNNQVVKLSAGNNDFLVKRYFRHPDDPRDRLGAEFRFLTYAAKLGACVPTPLLHDDPLGFVVMEFVQGARTAPGGIDAERVSVACMFLESINPADRWLLGLDLPPASESCFTIAEHLRLVGNRLNRFASLSPSASPLHDEARVFVETELRPCFERVNRSIRAACCEQGVDIRTPLSQSCRCVSPSDFGFHNCLRNASGHYRFIDFEYAGWDDPAKLACDFFLQPDYPGPVSLFPDFTEKLGAVLGDSECAARSALLFPLYRVKWGCILLNDFIGNGAERRAFSGTRGGDEQLRLQLLKAKRILG